MRVALLTPMKPPDHPVPSGDRTFARLIERALSAAGHHVERPSALRTWCREPGDLPAIERAAADEAERIAAAWRTAGAPDAVLTYHNYHKAPDLLGPRLARAFRLPYAIVEPSRARKQAAGPFALGFALADEALAAADALGAVTEHDARGLHDFAPDAVFRVAPFIDTAPFAVERPRHPKSLVCAAMMRAGRKARSVAVLAQAVSQARAAEPALTLAVAGDGPERPALEPLFPPGTFRGRLEMRDLAELFARSEVFVWPAIYEPFGFAFLEAQAAGLAVIGGDAPGVRDVVANGTSGHLVDGTDPGAMADAILTLVRSPDRLARMQSAARAFARANDLSAGAGRLDALLAAARARHARTRGRQPASRSLAQ